ncbi:hypothetical protein ACPPVO_47650 [Dactylosporangium sp. McL0621]|uniref:hypothetical protein n=1 Tax=Dactylosporangium sp. McL0621 TaxID=3415678 RepID=UPI003CE90BB4
MVVAVDMFTSEVDPTQLATAIVCAASSRDVQPVAGLRQRGRAAAGVVRGDHRGVGRLAGHGDGGDERKDQGEERGPAKVHEYSPIRNG